MDERRERTTEDVTPEQDLPRTRLQGLERHLWRMLGSGFLVLIPLIITVVVVRFVFLYVDDLLRPTIREAQLAWLDFPGVGVVGIILILYLVGVLVSQRVGRRAIDWQAAIFSRIPLVKTIYGVAKQATDALSSPLGHHYSRVVFVEWPREGYQALGFVTGHTRGSDGEVKVAVYVPTVPNPTSGNLAFVSEREIIETNLTVEDAMKLVFSGGIVMPVATDSRKLADPTQRPVKQ